MQNCFIQWLDDTENDMFKIPLAKHVQYFYIYSIQPQELELSCNELTIYGNLMVSGMYISHEINNLLGCCP